MQNTGKESIVRKQEIDSRGLEVKFREKYLKTYSGNGVGNRTK